MIYPVVTRSIFPAELQSVGRLTICYLINQHIFLATCAKRFFSVKQKLQKITFFNLSIIQIARLL